MEKEYYKDFYGCTASITQSEKGFQVKVRTSKGTLSYKKVCTSYRGAKIAMGRQSDCWQKVS